MQRLDLVKNQISCPKQPPQTCPKQCDKEKKLKGKTVVVTGGSRGIGLAIAIRCAKDGANIAILAKTVTPQPTLPGTFPPIQGLSTLLPSRSSRQAERPFLSLAISAISKV